ncbi:hypothetical protein HZA39_04845 [Candidatus Peregrinibacteria bacterium]|nr:hypothetical protein [Candidatus Peregrinibacteria bacterium]
MNSWYLIAAIVVLYFAFAFLKPVFKKIFKIAPCSICAAVSITWIASLIYYLLGGKIDILIITMLIGESIAGLMYKMEGWFAKFNLQRFWLMRIIIIAGGTAAMYSFLTKNYDLTMISVVTSIILMILIALLQKPKSAPHEKHSKVEEMLDSCC